MSVYRTSKNAENPYVMLDKRFLEDDRLSWRAKGILSYLLSKPDSWQTREKDLVKRSREGREAVRSAMRELESCGYMQREQRRTEKGVYAQNSFTIYEVPQSETPLTEKPLTGNPLTANPTLSNNDSTKTDFSKNEESKPSSTGDILTTLEEKLRPSPSSPDWYMATYNDLKPKSWKGCEVINADRKRKLKAFTGEYKDRAPEIFKAALIYVARDAWWSKKNLNFDTLFTKNHVTQFAEGALDALSKGTDPARAGLDDTYNSILEAIS